ncbi:MAG: ADP-ribosylation family protein [Sandaracinaceae bacterium]
MGDERRIIREIYGFDFPDEVEAALAFVREAGSDFDVLDLSLEGPLAVEGGETPKPWDGWPRHALDPPEFFTVMCGHTDGLHWGYWFDDPGGGSTRRRQLLRSARISGPSFRTHLDTAAEMMKVGYAGLSRPRLERGVDRAAALRR